MKQLPIDKSKKNLFNTPAGEPEERFTPGILADSLEVMEAYSLGKIASLEHSLNSLTIADHTKEIIFLCQEIKKEKKILLQIISKKARQ